MSPIQTIWGRAAAGLKVWGRTPARMWGREIAGASPPVTPADPASIPAPSYYWPLDDDYVDSVAAEPITDTELRIVPSLIFGHMATMVPLPESEPAGIRNLNVPCSRIVASVWVQKATVAINGDFDSLRNTGAWALKTAEFTVAAFTQVWLSPYIDTTSYIDELAIWLDPPAEWTAAAAAAAMAGAGEGVVWRDGQWWEVGTA